MRGILFPRTSLHLNANWKGNGIMQKEKDYFYCYNNKVRRYIDENGTRHIRKGYHEVTGYPYWVFEHTKRLSEILKKYKVENERK